MSMRLLRRHFWSRTNVGATPVAVYVNVETVRIKEVAGSMARLVGHAVLPDNLPRLAINDDDAMAQIVANQDITGIRKFAGERRMIKHGFAGLGVVLPEDFARSRIEDHHAAGFQKSATMTCCPSTVGKASEG